MTLLQKKVADGSLVARLYKQQSPALFAYLCKRMGSPESAEDVLIEVFVAALEMASLDELSEKEQISWLWRVARNKGVDAYRRSQVRQYLDLSLLTNLSEDNQHSTELIVLQREAAERLHSHLAKLPPAQQEAVRLRFAYGLRCAQIAQIMGKREKAVRSLLARALNVLRTRYEKEQGEAHL